MCGSRKFCQRGSNLTGGFFWLMRGEILAAGHHQPASETPFKWHLADMPDDGPTLNAGLVAL